MRDIAEEQEAERQQQAVRLNTLSAGFVPVKVA